MKKTIFNIAISVPSEDGLNKAVYKSLGLLSKVNLNTMADTFANNGKFAIEDEGAVLVLTAGEVSDEKPAAESKPAEPAKPEKTPVETVAEAAKKWVEEVYARHGLLDKEGK